ncbi:hypothetical protein ACFWVP_21955 [Streptomyces sp. NPDC058637]|uniref:hypothetical protein n=1 Tax=Streptomyces sp. NPDC058637 TaxID=3346569 RepID=UPI003647C7ED
MDVRGPYGLNDLRAMLRAVTGLAAAASLLAGAVGCGEDKRDYVREAWEQSVPPERLCGGAVSAEAGKALELITGSTRFEASAERYTVAAAAEEVTGIVSAFIPEPSGNKGDLCRIYTPVGKAGYELRVVWRLSDDARWADGNLPSGFTRLDHGQGATSHDEAYVEFPCRSKKLINTAQSPCTSR